MPGAAEPGATLHVYSDSDTTFAQRLNQGSNDGDLVAADGSFTVPLLPGDCTPRTSPCK